MTTKVAKPRALAKSARVTIVSQKITNVTHICPVMLKMREILRFESSANVAAWDLSVILKRPQPSCLKLLNGTLKLNIEGQTALLQSVHGAQVYAAVMDAAPHKPWYVERLKDFDVLALSKEVAAQKRRVDAALAERIG